MSFLGVCRGSSYCLGYLVEFLVISAVVEVVARGGRWGGIMFVFIFPVLWGDEGPVLAVVARVDLYVRFYLIIGRVL